MYSVYLHKQAGSCWAQLGPEEGAAAARSFWAGPAICGAPAGCAGLHRLCLSAEGRLHPAYAGLRRREDIRWEFWFSLPLRSVLIQNFGAPFSFPHLLLSITILLSIIRIISIRPFKSDSLNRSKQKFCFNTYVWVLCLWRFIYSSRWYRFSSFKLNFPLENQYDSYHCLSNRIF